MWYLGLMEIPLTQGKVCLIDDKDVKLIKGFCIGFDGRYVALYKNRKKLYLHRVITGIQNKGKKIVVDHKNRDPLDNRRKNLRVVTATENMLNQTRSPGKTGFRGVYYDPWSWKSKCGKFKYKRKKPYTAELKRYGKKYCLGRFKTAEDAHKAFLKKEKELFTSR